MSLLKFILMCLYVVKKIQNKEEFTQFSPFGYAGNNKYESQVTCIPLLPPCSHWQFAIFMIYLKQSQQRWSCQS